MHIVIKHYKRIRWSCPTSSTSKTSLCCSTVDDRRWEKKGQT